MMDWERQALGSNPTPQLTVNLMPNFSPFSFMYIGTQSPSPSDLGAPFEIITTCWVVFGSLGLLGLEGGARAGGRGEVQCHRCDNIAV